MYSSTSEQSNLDKSSFGAVSLPLAHSTYPSNEVLSFRFPADIAMPTPTSSGAAGPSSATADTQREASRSRHSGAPQIMMSPQAMAASAVTSQALSAQAAQWFQLLQQWQQVISNSYILLTPTALSDPKLHPHMIQQRYMMYIFQRYIALIVLALQPVPQNFPLYILHFILR